MLKKIIKNQTKQTKKKEKKTPKTKPQNKTLDLCSKQFFSYSIFIFCIIISRKLLSFLRPGVKGICCVTFRNIGINLLI